MNPERIAELRKIELEASRAIVRKCISLNIVSLTDQLIALKEAQDNLDTELLRIFIPEGA